MPALVARVPGRSGKAQRSKERVHYSDGSEGQIEHTATGPRRSHYTPQAGGHGPGRLAGMGGRQP
jgi:hypothetical protein